MKLRIVVPAVLALGLSALAGQLMPREKDGTAGATKPVSAKGSQGGTVAAVPPHRPAGYAPRVATGAVDHAGKSVGVSCMTCHATREPDRDQGMGGAVPDAFHQRVKYAHATQSCLSCHNVSNYDTLRMADGRGVAFGEAQQLCAQCHGPQTRDYRAGSHGGMTGYWDKTKGPRVRNTCTDCHDPHAPAYPALKPVFAPIDAAARQQAEREARHSAEHTTTSSHE